MNGAMNNWFARPKPQSIGDDDKSHVTLRGGTTWESLGPTFAGLQPHLESSSRAEPRGDPAPDDAYVAQDRRDPVRLFAIHLYLSETNANCDLLGGRPGFGNALLGYVRCVRRLRQTGGKAPTRTGWSAVTVDEVISDQH